MERSPKKRPTSSKKQTPAKSAKKQLEIISQNKKAPRIIQAPILEVYMRCVTWKRDSHGLFDYESKNIAKKNIKTHTGGKIVLLGDEIQLVSKNYQMESSSPDEDFPQPMLLLLPNTARDGFTLKNDTFGCLNDNSSDQFDPHYEQSMLTVVRNIKSTSNNLVSQIKFPYLILGLFDQSWRFNETGQD